MRSGFTWKKIYKLLDATGRRCVGNDDHGCAMFFVFYKWFFVFRFRFGCAMFFLFFSPVFVFVFAGASGGPWNFFSGGPLKKL
jgi:hypothetical protein